MKSIYTPITEDQRHAVATLLAAGVRTNAIIQKLGISRHTIVLVQKADTWGDLLASKEAAIADLMVAR